MTIGVPREVKDHETRVGVTPAGAKALVEAGHKVLVEHDAGALSAMPDDEYQNAGAEIVGSAYDVWRLADMIVKVKEPTEKGVQTLPPRPPPLHLSPPRPHQRPHRRPARQQSHRHRLRDRPWTAPERFRCSPPCPRSPAASPSRSARSTSPRPTAAAGLLLGGVPGVAPANVCIIGGGIVGTNAAKIALGMGAKVTLLDLNLNRLRELDDIFSGRVFTVASNSYNVERATSEADLVIGGVLIPGAAAPKIVTRAMVAKMKKGAVIVDVAIDQGGCIETARPTTHSDPSYEVDGVVHYCVTNMPAAVPNTSTLALTNATFPYVMKLARMGGNAAIGEDKGIAEGVNTFNGTLTYEAVAQAQKRDWKSVTSLL